MEKEFLYNLPIYGDILAISILQLIQKNPGVTVAAVERNLCGLKMKKKIKDVDYSGKFRLLPCRDVIEMIDRLMDMQLVIKTQAGFSRQFTLMLTENGESFLNLQPRHIHTDYKDFNDMEWREFLMEHDYTNDRYVCSDEDYKHFLHLLEHKNVVLTQYDICLPAFLKNIPGWREFTKEKIKGTGIQEKSYWRFVEDVGNGKYETWK